MLWCVFAVQLACARAWVGGPFREWCAVAFRFRRERLSLSVSEAVARTRCGPPALWAATGGCSRGLLRLQRCPSRMVGAMQPTVQDATARARGGDARDVRLAVDQRGDHVAEARERQVDFRRLFQPVAGRLNRSDQRPLMQQATMQQADATGNDATTRCNKQMQRTRVSRTPTVQH